MTIYRLTRTWSDPRMQQLAEWTAEMMAASESTAALLGCSPQAIVAQAALESGWGAAAIGKNLFGIKADPGWHAARQLVWTREVIGGKAVMVQDWFRDYASYAESIADHFDFLRANSRYAGVFDHDGSKSDVQYFQALKDSGYATDPDYVGNLTETLKSVQAFTVHMVPVDSAVPAPEPRLLFLGMAGPDVSALQIKLGIEVDGVFGQQTRSRVVDFQRDHKLTVDGIVGKDTRSALGF
jgi:flagellar protein FlgJ